MWHQPVAPEQLERLVDQLVEDFALPGVAIGVTVGGQTTYCCRGGLARDLPIGPTTPMYAASLTKQLIGALVAVAIEQGRLAYDGPVTAYLPALPAWMATVRVRHLLHHTAGLPELAESAETWPADNAAARRALRASGGPVSAPGLTYAYSNLGYILLAEILTAAFGRPVAAVARDLLFAPLDMAMSRLGGAGPHLDCYPDPPGTIGDGGWWTPIADLQRWLVALNECQLPYNLRRIEERGHLDDGTPLDYAWGLVVADRDGQRVVSHSGGWPGWRSQAIRLPERGVALAVLMHSDDDRSFIEAGARLTRLVRGE